MGIQGFYNFAKTNYNSRGKRCFLEKNDIKYDYVFLDYQSLFYNIVNLYKEVNYLIRLLYNLRKECEEQKNPFFDAVTGKSNMNYSIVLYIINNYKNLFKKLGLDLGKPSNYMPVYEQNKQEQREHNIAKINALLALFPVDEIVFIDVIVEDIINHTMHIASNHLKEYQIGKIIQIKPENCLIFFDGIPSIAKMKEQIGRRIGGTIFKYINKDIVNNIKSTPALDLEKEIYSKFLPDQISIGIDTPVVNKTRQRLKELGYNVNDVNKYGEAEHQIMKKLTEPQFKRKEILLASPDADLILLGMISLKLNNFNLTIYRESAKVDGGLYFDYEYSYEFVDEYEYLPQEVSMIKDGKLVPTTTFVKTKKLEQVSKLISPYKRDIVYIKLNKLANNFGLSTPNKVYDVSYLFLLLGDDFIPIIPSFNVDALTKILDIYNRMSAGFHIINIKSNPFEINFTNLISFLDDLKNDEQILFENKRSKHDGNVKKRETQAKNDFKNIKKFFNISPDREIVKKRQVYLDKGILLKDNATTELLIHELTQSPPMEKAESTKMIKNYLEGCQFIFDLYFLNDNKNYKWHYKYEVAPHLSDIVKFLNTINPYPAAAATVEYKKAFDYSNGLNIKQEFKFMDIELYKLYSNESKNKIFREIYNRIFPGDAAGDAAIDNSVPLTDEEFTRAFTFANVKKIFMCTNQMYFNKCINYDDSMIDPNTAKFNRCIDTTYLNKYLKYKTKYLKLLEKN
jgi:hypothetical protein